jgi:hypothetical protein
VRELEVKYGSAAGDALRYEVSELGRPVADPVATSAPLGRRRALRQRRRGGGGSLL